MFDTLRYYCLISRGYRFQPWESPYIRWRMETFFGPDAAELRPKLFLQLLWRERRRIRRFARWAAERRAAQRAAR